LPRDDVDFREVDRGEEAEVVRAFFELEQHVDCDSEIIALRAEIHTRQTMRSRPIARPKVSCLRSSNTVRLKRDRLRPLDYALEDHKPFRLGGVGIHAGAPSTGLFSFNPRAALQRMRVSPSNFTPVAGLDHLAFEPLAYQTRRASSCWANVARLYPARAGN
jgi:hypothetical protein